MQSPAHKGLSERSCLTRDNILPHGRTQIRRSTETDIAAEELEKALQPALVPPGARVLALRYVLHQETLHVLDGVAEKMRARV